MKHTPRHVMPAVVGLVMAVSLASCLGGSSERRYYYSLQYPRGERVKRYEQVRYPYVVRIKRFHSEVAYDRQEIVYRLNPYEISYDWYRLWTAKPRKMIAQLMRSHLRDTNMFREVVDRVSGTLPKYEIECEVGGIEELDSSRDQWFARLALDCHLTDFTTGAHLWDFNFDRRKRVFQRLPHFVVRALSEIMEEQMARMLDSLDTFVAKHNGMPPPKLTARLPDKSEDSASKPSTVSRDQPVKTDDSQPGAVLKTKHRP